VIFYSEMSTRLFIQTMELFRRFSHRLRRVEITQQVESTYGEMVQFSNTDYANEINEHTPALDFA
jgi:hypothetical protein